MISFEDIKTVYDKISLDELSKRYEKREDFAKEQDEKQFSAFLAELNKQLSNEYIPYFKNTLLKAIINNIYQGSTLFKRKQNEELLESSFVLHEISKPKTNISDRNESPKENTSLSELPYSDKLYIIFKTIFGKFDLNVQKQFLKLLKSFNYNSSMELLEFITCIINFHRGKYSFESLKEDLPFFTTINTIRNITSSGMIIDTIHGSIPISYATDILDIEDDPSLFKLGDCHDLTSEALLEFPNLYGAYYYIPNHFKGYFDHTVLIDYKRNYVYDLSHNIAMPLEYFSKYHSNISFIISGYDFQELFKRTEEEYGVGIYTWHLEEIKRELKK